jgi:hypothetical protein
MNKYDDLFDDDGELAIPTVRGSANLDVEDYEGYDGRSAILDDELQEDTISSPGFNPGAAPAPDVYGDEEYQYLHGDMAATGMKQTTYGASPWGPGSNTGYRPYSQQRTDMSLRALGDTEQPTPKPVRQDDMMREPEVINAVPVEAPVPWDEEWHANRNQQPSNAEIDPMTLYDRSSYEYDESSQDTIGSGIFGMEEGVTWRPRDGIFADQYALPAYIAAEDELGVQQSEMWDSTADEWRVTQPSASGVALARKVSHLKKDPFMPQMRPEVTGPRSHVEAFGRKVAGSVMAEARAHRPEHRGQFLNNALQALGPAAAKRCREAADRLIKLGYPADVALEDAVAHCVMHAATQDLTTKVKRNKSMLPRLDNLAKRIRREKPAVHAAAATHLGPLTKSNDALRSDLGALYASPAGRGMGQVAENGAAAPAVPSPGLVTPRNIVIAGGLGLGAYFLYANRDKLVANLKKLVK